MCYCIANAYCYFFMTFNSLSGFMEFTPIFRAVSGVKPLFSRTIKKTVCLQPPPPAAFVPV